MPMKNLPSKLCVFLNFNPFATTARVIETNWNTHYDAECGAIVEFDRIRIPLSKVETKKKSFRRAIYIIGNIGRAKNFSVPNRVYFTLKYA